LTTKGSPRDIADNDVAMPSFLSFDTSFTSATKSPTLVDAVVDNAAPSPDDDDIVE
jgi:hypothetical protein